MSERDPRFDLDLTFGQEGEDLVRDLLGGEGRIEVKRDRKALETGNVFVEVTYRGQPSGIQTTEADWWAFVVGSVIFLVPMLKLRHFCAEAWNGFSAATKIRGTVYGGDDGRSFGVLVPLAELARLS